jgi:guanylate kinase
MARRGFPVVLSAASGTGKTTLSHLLLEADKELKLSISFTTRAPRGEERNGVDYHFVDEETFQQMIDRGELLEWAKVHGHHYGSSARWTEEVLSAGEDVLFDIDVQGGKQIRQRFPEACLIFLVPPSMEILEGRLRGRGTDDEAVIARRLEAARAEIDAGLETYDYVCTNDRLDRAIFDLTAIVRAHRLKMLSRADIRRRLLGDTPPGEGA